MGDSACQIIINDGNQAYGIIEQFVKDHPSIQTAMLEASVEGSCQAIHHASLYFLIEGEENKLTTAYTQPIIDIHHKIIEKLPTLSGDEAQDFVNRKAQQLYLATKKLEELYTDTTVETKDTKQ